jgi:hypothetical protein
VEETMKRGYLLITVLLLMLPSSASAEIFRCRTADGRLVMTDNPTSLPAGCVQVDKPAGTGSFNVVPAAPASQSETPAEPGSSVEEPKSGDQTTLLEQARLLVQDYEEAVARRYRVGRVAEQNAAMRDIGELKRQKEDMLRRVDSAGLNQEERHVIRRTLDRIPRR